MKDKIIKALQIFIFLTVFFLVLFRVYKIVSWKDTTGDYMSSVKQLEATDKDLIDAVFLGSSHVYCSVNPSVIWKQSGYSVFDMSISGMDKASLYYSLKELLKTQSPKVVVVDLFGLTYDKHEIEGNVYRNYLSHPFSLNSLKLINQFIDQEDRLEYIFKWPIVHTRYRELGKYDFVENAPSIFGRGETLTYRAETVDFSTSGHLSDEIEPLEGYNLTWLEDLYELSQKEGFELCFMVVPFVIKEEYQGLMNAAADFSKERGIAFYDFNRLHKEIGLDYDKDFQDISHLNSYGAEKFSSYLLANVLKNYELIDHRGDEKYSLWDEDLKWNEMSKLEWELSNTSDLATYMSLLKDNPDYTCVLSLETSGEAVPESYVEAAGVIGISESDAIMGGKWIFSEGEVYKAAGNDSDESPFALRLSSTETLRIHFYSMADSRNMMINRTSVSAAGFYATVVVYNNFTERLVSYKGF